MPKQNPLSEPNDTSSADPYDGEPRSHREEWHLWTVRDVLHCDMLKPFCNSVIHRSLHWRTIVVFQKPKKKLAKLLRQENDYTENVHKAE